MRTTNNDYIEIYRAEINDHWNKWYGKIGRFILNWILAVTVIELIIMFYCFAFTTEANPLIYEKFTNTFKSNTTYFLWLASVFIYPILRQAYINRKIKNIFVLAQLQNYRENLLFNANKFSTVEAGRSFYASLHPLNKNTLMNELSITNDLLSAILQHYCNHNKLNTRHDHMSVNELINK